MEEDAPAHAPVHGLDYWDDVDLSLLAEGSGIQEENVSAPVVQHVNLVSPSL